MNDTIQSEYGVIGGICLDPTQVDKLAAFLYPDDFTNQSCADVYAEAVQNRKTFDATVAANLLTPRLGEKEAAKFITGCLDMSPTLVNLEYHANAVHESARFRRLRDAAAQALMDSPDGQALADTLAGLAQRYLQEGSREATTMMRALVDLLNTVQQKDERKLNTGFHRLDGILKGLRPGQLIVIGARPGVGKSAFLLNLALNTARVGKVILFSMEMTAAEIAQRSIVTKSPLTLDVFLDDGITEKNLQHVTNPAGEISKLHPIVIDDRPALTIEQLRARVRLHPDTRLVIVDYLQLMQTSRRREGRNWELGELTRSLKNFSVEAGVPIIVAAQLNRETDDTERPSIRSIRDSGEIEAHASKVLLMWKTGKDNLVAVDVAKNRNGRTGVVQFEFIGEHMIFSESPLKYEGPSRKKKHGFIAGED